MSFEIEASARHVHLSNDTIAQLFGFNYKLTPVRPLSQPGQYVSKEKVILKGPKGQINNVSVLGPAREHSQVELSITDALSLGVDPPIRESGHLDQTPGITLINGNNSVNLNSGVIIAQRHIHITPEDAKIFGVQNNDIVSVKTSGKRSVIFNDVVIRVSEKFATRMHIDFDEANACGFVKGMRGTLYKK
ncbi:Phosphate propanoyltransferase [Bombilactobacillus mellis]|uniref:Phosphate propanoyltransferase n=1 Tax=Bombilactobacillus mellis TaxID=1218508 RepID=A0A0F4KQV9_9LACO|nr:phosphate propanoyltransferase [Bombilactobacillus mellis]KJY48399.1 Phosphate propanoyltransferase [Bombilactobacillus mellis]